MNGIMYQGIGIHIKVANLDASRAFYEDILDMIPSFGYGSDEFRKSLPSDIPSIMEDGLPGAPEKYNGLTYEPTPQSPIEIAEGHIAVPNAKIFQEAVSGPKISSMMRVSSLLPLVRDKGVKPKFPVRHYYWGTIEMAIRDPDGFVIVLIAPYSQAEQAALSEFVSIEEVNPQ